MSTTRRVALALVIVGAALAVVWGVGLAFDFGSSSNATRTAATPTPTTSVRPTQSSAVIESPTSFMASFVTARRTGNLAALVGRLHPLTIQRYGSTQCRKAVAGLVDRTLTLKVTDVDPPSVFNYDTDGKHVALPDVIGIHTTGTARGQSVTLVTHALAVGGRYYVFADCGTPIS